jgi:hypothetical protein
VIPGITADHSVVVTFSPTYTLSVVKTGSGTGTVTGAPKGIACGSICQKEYALGSKVTLTAKADTAAVFTGWSGGGCSGTKPCQVTISDYTTVTATFVSEPHIVITPLGLSYGNVVVGKTKPLTVTVKNTGKRDLIIGTAAISDGTEFTLPPGNDLCSGKTLAPMKTCTIKPIFAPTSKGGKAGTLFIPSNDPETPIMSVGMSGIGI